MEIFDICNVLNFYIFDKTLANFLDRAILLIVAQFLQNRTPAFSRLLIKKINLHNIIAVGLIRLPKQLHKLWVLRIDLFNTVDLDFILRNDSGQGWE